MTNLLKTHESLSLLADKIALKNCMNKVVPGDCIDLMKSLPEKSFDMIFADPPYHMQLGNKLTRPEGGKVDSVSDGWDKFSSRKAYKEFSKSWIIQANRLLKDTGTLWVIGSYHNIYTVGSILQDLGLWILNDVIWHKVNPMPNFLGTRFTNSHEILLWCKKENKPGYTFNYQSLKTSNDDKQMTADWHIPICTGKERLQCDGKKVHSTQKPEALLRRVILASTNQNDLILDPFFGSGTTGVVAKMLNRRFVGFEKDKKYVSCARERLSGSSKIQDFYLKVVPSRQDKPRVPFGLLVESGVIKPGDTLYPALNKFEGHNARVLVDGSIELIKPLNLSTTLSISKLFSNFPIIGSIHKVGALIQGKVSCNGWQFWNIKRSQELMLIDVLRDEFNYRKESKAVPSTKFMNGRVAEW